MRHPRVDELLRDPPPDESDALGPLDDPAAVLALRTDGSRRWST